MTGNSIRRGNNQCHYRFFPNSVYLHDGMYVRVKEWKTQPIGGIDKAMMLDRISVRLKSFGGADNVPNQEHIDLRELSSVRSSIFPKTFWCKICGRIVYVEKENQAAESLKEASLKCNEEGHSFYPIQFRFVTVDACGYMGEAFSQRSLKCPRHPRAYLKLNMHNSERLSNFRLECEVPGCSTDLRLRETPHDCTWPPNERPALKSKEGIVRQKPTIELVTKNVVTIPEIFTSVNLQDSRRLEIKKIPSWEQLVFKYCIDSENPISSELVNEIRKIDIGSLGLSSQLEQYKESNPEAAKEIEEILEKHKHQEKFQKINIEKTKSEELLDYLLAINQPPFDVAHSIRNELKGDDDNVKQIFNELGIEDIVAVDKLNLTTVLYGYSRGTYDPSDRKFNFFETNGRSRRVNNRIKEIYCSPKFTEGIIIRVDPIKLYKFSKNESKENSNVDGKDRPYYFRKIIEEYDEKDRRLIQGFSDPNSFSARLYGVLHTLSHLFIRSLGRLSGVEENSIAEILFPNACSILLYVNQSNDFSLGTLPSTTELKISKLSHLVKDLANDCLYDPICTIDLDGSCPACIQIGEVSCEAFNRDMSRKILIGGDSKIGFWSL